MDLEDGKTLPAKVKLLRYEGDKTWLELTITEGRNQQVRRMGDATGFRVMRLARMSFAGVGTEGLAPGRWRYLTADELATLKKDFGVPKRVVSPPKLDAAAASPAAGRVRPGIPPTRPRGPVGADSKRSKRAPSGGPHAGNRGSRSQQGSSGPRYGGGSPGRRGVDVRDDWGGGVQRGGRGGAASRDEQADRTENAPPRGDVGGRGGRTRTTGSGGGIGAGAGSYRVKGRRG